METYRQFLDRIYSFEKKELDWDGGDFVCSPSVALKVDSNNKFKRFYGDTVIFALDDNTKKKISGYVDLLYKAAPQCFCERLAGDTFHVTLHDLSNSPNLSDVAEEVFFNELNILGKREELRRLGGLKIRLKSKYLFNMVNTSLVLGVCPASEADYDRLMTLYSVIDGVKKLSYPLTPHITLGYYNVGGFDSHAAAALVKEVNKLNNEIDMYFDLGKLYYQKFTSMNDYIDIFDLTNPDSPSWLNNK